MKKVNGFLSVWIIWILIVICRVPVGSQQTTPIAQGELAVKGLTLEVDPFSQTVPVNTPTTVNINFSVDTPQLIRGIAIKGDLRGPGLQDPVALTTLPGHPFAIPALSAKGDYFLENIRVERDGQVLLKGNPDSVVIRVMDIVVTRVETRPLTLQEIQDKGINITDENFTVFNFSIGILVESKEYRYDFPVVYTDKDPYIPLRGNVGGGGGGGGMGRASGRQLVPFELKFPGVNQNIGGAMGGGGDEGNRIAGVLMFNNDVAFLHQFFSVMFIVTNNAPEGSDLVLKDLKATITLPDELAEGKTTPPHIVGTPIPVRCPGPDEKLGTADDLDIILATFSGMAEFLAEGLEKGTHIIKVDFDGTLSGLPTGDVPVEGSASGAVVVRDPEFSVTFSHPEVIRDQEEYDIFVTISNTSTVPANLVSLTMPAAQLIGTELLSVASEEGSVVDETVTYDTIGAGESATTQFRMKSKETGKVRATAISTEGNISGQIILTVGVGEEGIPLSPDTLVLPGYVYDLPFEIINAAMLLLGEAHSIAKAPPGGLPDHLPIVSIEAVEERVIDLTEAGQRIKYMVGDEDNKLKSLEVLTLDWLGSRYPDLPFDMLRRLTTKGEKLAAELAADFNQQLQSNSPAQFQMQFAQTCSYKDPFISACLDFGPGARTAHLVISDKYQNVMTASGEALTREIPFAELFLMEDDNQFPADFALIGHLDENDYTYTFEVKGEASGSFNLSLVVPDPAGGLKQVVFSDIPRSAGSQASITIQKGDSTFILKADTNGDGVLEDFTGAENAVEEPALELLHAIQDCKVDHAGHVVALLFNRAVSQDTAKNKENFSVTGKQVYASFLQPSERVILVGLDNPISPFVTGTIHVENLTDSKGNLMAAVDKEIEATIETKGGIVYGRVLTASGQPVPNARLRLQEKDINSDFPTNSYTRTDSLGNYQFDFVRILDNPFNIVVTDIYTGKSERMTGRVTVHGQRLNMDIFMKGRGSVGGVVQDELGNPLEAFVYAYGGSPPQYEYFRTRCNENGEFLITDIPLGPVELRASYISRGGVAGTVIGQDGEVRNVTITLEDIPLGTVNGRIFESDGVTPIERTAVYLFYENKPLNYLENSDEEGFFQFDNVPVGQGTYIIVSCGPDVTITLSAGDTVSVVIIKRGSGSISGTVYDYQGNEFNGITVYLQGTQFYTTTHQDEFENNGKFSFDKVPVGSYTIVAYDPNTYQEARAGVRVHYEGEEVSTSLAFPMPPGKGDINGSVYKNNTLLSSPAEVWVFDANFNYAAAATTSGGNFQVNDLPAGKYVLAVHLGDLAGVGHAVVKDMQQPAEVDIHLIGMGTINITVLNNESSPVMADVSVRYPTFALSPGKRVGFSTTESHYVSSSSSDDPPVKVGPVFYGAFTVFAKNAFYPQGAFATGTLTDDIPVADVTLHLGSTYSVTVEVVDCNGVAVDGAEVTLKTGSLPSVDTNTVNGICTFSIVPPGNFTIEATHPNQLNKGRMNGYLKNEDLDLTLKLKGTGTVKVMVKENELNQGSPVTGAVVKLRSIGFPYQNKIASEIGNGEYRFDDILEGRFSIDAYHSDPARAGRVSGIVTAPGELVEVTLELDAYGTVNGTVFQPDNETVVENAQVVIYPEGHDTPFGYATTGADGTFSFEYVPRIPYKVEAFEPASGRKGKKSDEFAAGQETQETNITLEGRGSVSGTFYDGSGVNPVANATVTLSSSVRYPYDVTTSTDGNGNFEFVYIPEGGFTLTASHSATNCCGEAEGTIEYEGHNVFVDIISRATGKVTGTVYTAGMTGTVEFPNVKIEGRELYGTSFEDGTFNINFVPIGNFTVVASKNGDSGSAAGKIDYHGHEAEVVIEFDGFGSVSGVVTQGGIGFAGANVLLKSGSQTFTRTSGNGGDGNPVGWYSVDQVPLGSFLVKATDPGNPELGGSASGILDRDNRTATANIEIEDAGSVSGRVLQADGTTPVEKAYISLKGVTTVGGQSFTLYTITDGNGNFQYDVVRKSTFTVEIVGDNNAGLAKRSGEINANADPVDFGDITLDNVKPTITNITPANGTVDVSPNPQITINFSEPMDTATLNSTNIQLRFGDNPLGIGVSVVDNQTVNFDSTILNNFGLYVIYISDAVMDDDGNPLDEPVTSTFTTMDTTPPEVVSISPAPNAKQVAVDSVITVTFNEPIATSQFNGQNITVSNGGPAVSGDIAFSNNNMTMSFTPLQALETNSTYTVSVQDFMDISGLTQTSPFTSSFNTLDTDVPNVTLVTSTGETSFTEGSSLTVIANTSATDVAAVYFYINGQLKHTDPVSTYEYSFNAPLISEVGSSFVVEAYAVDKVGNQGAPDNITITLESDGPPQVSITAPGGATIFPGDAVSYTVDANDDLELKTVTFTISDPWNYNDSDSPASKTSSHTYNLTVPADISPGSTMTAAAEAEDTRDQVTTSNTITLQVPVDNASPTITIDEPASFETFGYNAVINIEAVITDDVGINISDVNKKPSVSISYEGLQGDGILETTTVKDSGSFIATASYTVPQLTEDKTATITVTAEDLMGNPAEASVQVYLARHVDTDAPVVSLLTPTSGTLVYPDETLPIWVNASDANSGIDRVEFFINDETTPHVTVTDTDPTSGWYQATYSVPTDAVAGSTITIKVVAWEDKISDPLSSYEQTLCQVVSGDIEYIDSDITIDDQNRSGYENKTIVIKGDNTSVTMNCSTQFSFADLVVKDTATLTHGLATASTVEKLDIFVTGKVVVGPNAAIDVDKKGFLGAYQGDNSSNYGHTLGFTAGSDSYSGASYGGLGGTCTNLGTTYAVNDVYGSIYDPLAPGSGGGGTSSSYCGGNGGGVIRINASEIIVDGAVNSNGGSVANTRGAGSGGSIRLDVTTLKGSGQVTANGGDSFNGGAGGGGRIAIYYTDGAYFDFINNVTVHGGNATVYQADSVLKGSAGTIYLKKSDQDGQIIIRQNDNGTNKETPLTAALEGEWDSVSENTLTDEQANFTPGSLVGMDLQPNINDPRTFKILSNTQQTITVETYPNLDLDDVADSNDRRYRVRHPAHILLEDGITHIHGDVTIPTLQVDNGTLIFDGTLFVDTLTLANNSILKHSRATTNTVYSLHVVAEEIYIDSGSAIDVSNCGYLGGYQGDNDSHYGRTYGNLPDEGSYFYSGGSGGGYGGESEGHPVNDIYGSFKNPTAHGSGGGGHSVGTYAGRNGGGVIRLEANEIVLDGDILANGGSAGAYRGAGSGGSILIDVTKMSGIGKVQAQGGDWTSGPSAGGGGGRIAIYYDETQSTFDFNNNVTAYGGYNENPPSGTAVFKRNGGPGSIYLKTKVVETGRLIVNNRGEKCNNGLIFPLVKPATITAINTVDNLACQLETSGADYMPDSLVGMTLVTDINQPGTFFTIVANGRNSITVDGDLTGATSYKGILVYDEQLEISNAHVDIGRDVELGTLIISNNSTLSHPVTAADDASDSFLFIKAGTITVDSGSRIDVSARGYLGGYRDDNTSINGKTFGNTTVGGCERRSGGSFGGIGGKYQDIDPPNEIYGSLYQPFIPGSGGGAYQDENDEGGNGGGIIRIEANLLNINGDIVSNGGVPWHSTTYSPASTGGCGSGGSIWMDITTLNGTGTISANGAGNKYCGAGGGGRIAVYYDETASNFVFDNGNVTAFGGDSIDTNIQYNGGAGTIYLKKKVNGEDELIIDNNNIQTWNEGTGTGNAEYTTPLPAVGTGPYTNLDNQNHSMMIDTQGFITDALKGIKLNLNPAQTNPVFTIISNTEDTIFTDPAEGDLSGSGSYIGEHHLFRVTIKGWARVSTTDRIIVDLSRLTVEANSALNKAE